jgi:chorismate dehydratase
LRISLVDFLNARPLTWGLLHEPPEGVEVSRDLPSVCAEKLAAGEADVGLIPSIEYQRIPDLTVIPSLGIAASSEVRSVLLVSRVSREKISSVALDPGSRTAAALTRILLKRRYGIEPEYRQAKSEVRRPKESDAPFAGCDAGLIIGDPALKAALNGYVVLDLAAEWRAFTGRPFVFAFWAVRQGADAYGAERILRESYDRGRAEFDRLVREEAQHAGLSEPVVEDYLRHSLHYELDRGDLGALELFYRLAADQGLIPEARPLALLGHAPAPTTSTSQAPS